MCPARSLAERLLAPNDQPATGVDPDTTPGADQKRAEAELPDLRERLGDLQERLWAEGTRSLLLVLQGMDTSGKGGTLGHVVSSMDPAGVDVAAFKAPTDEELAHDFLWRIERRLPEPGEIVVFDRSHYEDVLVVARARGGGRADLAGSLRPDQRVRASGGRGRHDDREVLPAHLLRRAARTAPGAVGRSHEALEVPRTRHRRARALARLHGGVRRRDRAVLLRRGPVVRRSPPTTSGTGTGRSPPSWSRRWSRWIRATRHRTWTCRR